jgi:hypothetical protein
MERTLNAMKVAARVLVALGEHQAPDQADVDELRSLDPLMNDMPLDDLACDVIQQALKRRAELKQQHNSGLGAC